MLDISNISSINELSEDNKQNLQCGYCGNLLSVPGITVPDAKDSLYACGRCSKTKGSGIPACAYETIASLVKFPCRYVTYGCSKKFLMEAVLDHERACKHRIYKCFAANCNWEGTIAALKGHITNCHSNIILKDGSFKMPLDDITSLYIMYMYDEIYLVKVHVKDLIFHLGVKYLGKPPECGRFTYEAEIKKTGAKQQSSIKLYNGKMKCYTDYKNLSEKIDVDFDIKSLDGIFKTRKVDCFINIIENVPKKEKSPKPTATNLQETRNNEVVGSSDASNMQTDNTNKAVTKEEITLTDNTNNNVAKKKKKNNNTGKSSSLKEQQMQYENQQADMIRELECPVCQEYIYPPIMICVSGHSICGDCKSKLTKCPTCSSEYGNTRNYALENMLNLVQLPCRNDINGCEFLGNFAALQEHKVNCKYAEFKCPVPYHCKWIGVGATTLVEKHLNDKHFDKFITLNTQFSYSLNHTESQHHLIKYKGDLFRVSFKCSKKSKGLAQWSFQKLFKTWPRKDYKIDITFQDGTNTRRKFIINDGFNDVTDYDYIFYDTLAIPLDLLKPYVDSRNNLCLSYKIY